MKEEELRDSIAEIYSYFRYAEMPGTRVIEAWFKKLKYIPEWSLKYIVNQVCELESLPRNLPKAIQALYEQYKREHPEETILKACPDCHSHGYFIVRKWEPDYGYHAEYIVKCGACSNIKKHINAEYFTWRKEDEVHRDKMAVASFQELKDKGFEIKILPDYTLPTFKGKLLEKVEVLF